MTDNNTKNISDENRVKLQEFLEKASELWFRNKLNSAFASVHDLFSKDSGLMEFMNWKMMEEWYEDYKKISTRYDYRWDNERQYHAMVMWPMTAEQKLQYFLDNAVLPQ